MLRFDLGNRHGEPCRLEPLRTISRGVSQSDTWTSRDRTNAHVEHDSEVKWESSQSERRGPVLLCRSKHSGVHGASLFHRELVPRDLGRFRTVRLGVEESLSTEVTCPSLSEETASASSIIDRGKESSTYRYL